MKDKGSQFEAWKTEAPPGPVFHGSGHGFAPGDKIDPTPDRTHMGGESAAFGATNTDTAGYFGLYGATNQAERPGVQGRLFSSIYEVGPTSGFERHPSPVKSVGTRVKYARDDWEAENAMADSGPNTMPIDRGGFEVKRHAGFAFPEHHDYGMVEKVQETPKGAG